MKSRCQEEINMNHMKTPKDTALAFCQAWFEKCDLQATVVFLHDHINFVGTGEGESARGKAEMTEYISKDISELAQPFICSLQDLNEQKVTEQVCNLSMNMTLKNEQYLWRLRAFFLCCKTAAEHGKYADCTLQNPAPISGERTLSSDPGDREHCQKEAGTLR